MTCAVLGGICCHRHSRHRNGRHARVPIEPVPGPGEDDPVIAARVCPAAESRLRYRALEKMESPLSSRQDQGAPRRPRSHGQNGCAAWVSPAKIRSRPAPPKITLVSGPCSGICLHAHAKSAGQGHNREDQFRCRQSRASRTGRQGCSIQPSGRAPRNFSRRIPSPFKPRSPVTELAAALSLRSNR